MPDLVGSIPQWITAVVAMGAFGVGVASIRSQREIARKRAATDFFLKTEMDPATLEAHKKYVGAIEKLRMVVTDKGEMQNSFANTDEYWAIRDYLNLHELVAVGLLNGVFDDDVCFDFWSGELVLGYEDALPLIRYVQKQKRGENTYSELAKVASQWSKRKNVC